MTSRPKRRIRLALVTAGLLPGGAERQMLLLVEGLPKDEFTVDFLLLTVAGDDADRARAAGARVRVFGIRPRRNSGLPLPLYLVSVAWGACRFVLATTGRYDVMDAWLFHAYALTAISRPFTRPRAVIAGRRSLNDFKQAFGLPSRVADVLARRGSDVIVANSRAVKEDVIRRERIDAARIRVIHNGVPPAEPMTEDARRARRAAWGATDDSIVIGSVANYKPGKGLDVLIRAAGRLAADGGRRDLRLVLVGDGRERDHLEALRLELGELQDVVVLHGTEPDARAIYGAFDVAVLASKGEGLPNVVLEAAAAGLPIVATAAGGTVEIIADGVTGLLVPVGDEDALLAALWRLCDDPTERRRLGEAARLDVTTRFGVDRMVAEFAALYREFAAGRGRTGNGRR